MKLPLFSIKNIYLFAIVLFSDTKKFVFVPPRSFIGRYRRIV